MTTILALLENITPILSKTTIRQMSQIIYGILSGTGRITMLGLSRWTEKGGSYRTIQRFYHNTVPWMQIQWKFFQTCFLKSQQEYILAGDETVVSKAGKQTYGLDRFFSGLRQRVIPSIAFFAFSLIDIEEERSYPVQITQVVKSVEEKVANKAKAEIRKKQQKSTEKKKRGRPKGSKNKPKQEMVLNRELLSIQKSLQELLEMIGKTIKLKYVALDGHFGNYPAAKMVREICLHLISKMRSDASLFMIFDGEHKKRGRKSKYGKKIDVRNMDPKYLKSASLEGNIHTDIYQGQFLNKEFPFPLNVVIILKTNLDTQKQAHVILFSTDLELKYEKMIHYYSLRFQIEFNFRDAKQYWGLEDFMNIKETAVTNAANLSLFMVNFSDALMQPFRQQNPDYSVLDLKSHFRGLRYASETIKMLPKKPDNILLHQIFEQIARLGAIHTLSNPSPSP
jgi:hypothetical protein